MNPHSRRHHVAARFPLLAGAAGLLGCSGPAAEAPLFEDHVVAPIEFVSAAGDTIQAERGQFTVPENRQSPSSRRITLAYVRFPATTQTPGSPIVYLAGGPGGSGIGTARGRRFPLFMALRSVADVIAFDQRGTGESNAIPPCETQRQMPADQPATIDAGVELLRAVAKECLRDWAAAGVDMAGYTTLESASDLDALRHALGADRVNLWGISYGTHLALAALKVMEPGIDRLVLASVEGLDQTVKLPARTDRYFERLQQAIDADPAAKARYPDLVAMMRRVLSRLAESPVRVEVPAGDGKTATLVMGPDEVRLLSGSAISDPEGAAMLLRLYRAADQGDWAPLAQFVSRFARRPIQVAGMPEVMDAASGIGAERLALVRQQAETSLLGDLLNFPIPHLIDPFGLVDLGDDFRSAPRSSRPALVLSGTLDGRTYPESHREAVSGLSQMTFVTVERAGHNLFMVSPAVGDVIARFLRGEPVADTTITIPLADFGS